MFLDNHTTVSDEELLARSRIGDDEAFAELASRYSAMLGSLVSKYGNGPNNDDLSQEGLLGLLSAVQTYRSEGDAAFATYAYTCMRNRMLSVLRAARGDVSELSFETEIPASTAHDPAAVLVRLEELKALRLRLRQTLTDLEYQVLMRHVAAYSYEEIATELGIGRKSVDNALSRLRRKLAATPILFRL